MCIAEGVGLTSIYVLWKKLGYALTTEVNVLVSSFLQLLHF